MALAKHKKAAIITGLCMGLLVPFGAMTLTPSHSNAAILVYDAQNVAEAIKEAINTANILTENQKQVAMMLLNIKSLTGEKIAEILQQQVNAEKSFNWCKTGYDLDNLEAMIKEGKIPGILDVSTPWDEKGARDITGEILKKSIGNVDDIFASLSTPLDPYKQIQMNLKAVNATAASATRTAQAVQMSDQSYAKSIQLSLDAANNAEGTKQVQQSIAAMTATNAMETRNGNEMLSQLVGLTAEDIYAKNVERASAEKRLQDSKDALHLTAFGSKN